MLDAGTPRRDRTRPLHLNLPHRRRDQRIGRSTVEFALSHSPKIRTTEWRTVMFRSSRLVVALLSAILLSSPLAHTAHAQQQPAVLVDLNQTLLERWIAVIPALLSLSKPGVAPQSDAEARPHMERICAEAEFDNYDQCAQVIGYVGVIVGACDRRTQTFGDPVLVMRRHLARLRANTRMPAAKREQAVADVEKILAEMPDSFPAEHLALMNANRARIFAALRLN